MKSQMVIVNLTPRLADFVHTSMRTLDEVTDDASVRRDARAVMRRIEAAGGGARLAKPTKAQRVHLEMAVRFGGLTADWTTDPRTIRALLRNGWIRKVTPDEMQQRFHPDYVITPAGRAALEKKP